MDFKNYISILNSDVRILKGIGEKKAEALYKLGIRTIWDVLYNFPRTYEDRRKIYKIADAPKGVDCCIDATVCGAVIEKKIKPKMSLYILRVTDSTGFINIKWFSSPFNKHKIRRGMRYIFYGTIEQEMLLKVMEPYGENEYTGKIVPVYSLSAGLTQKNIINCVDNAFNLIDSFFETLPDNIISEYNLLSLGRSLYNMHHPENDDIYEKSRYRLAFEELFILSLAMKKVRTISGSKNGISVKNIKCASEFAQELPFELTVDQKRVINEICSDLRSPLPMNRLVQGDVGSGKTAVAAVSAYVMAKNGFQTAFMAPTEILAQQHFKTLSAFFKNTGIKIALITGSAKNKNSVLNAISDGTFGVVVGTHALIEDCVTFNNLGLCITDEQHRFGVRQRAALSKGEDYPNVLVMSATPIPRTLSLVLYGDLDVSVIKSLPSGRKKVDTFCINESARFRMEEFVKKEINNGHQCFVVCPLIEESEKIEANSAQKMFDKLKKRFPECNIAFLHGKMSSMDKDCIMEDFREKKYQILVSTTVIEVGIDIPNATVMIIENAERFGLSQLHQLRGRVGRGENKSYCILVSETRTDDSKERMKIMCTHSDGFEIATEDLRLRGCGEFFGTKQHGIPELRVANLYSDLEIASSAREACDMVISEDPALSGDTYSSLGARIDKLFGDFEAIKILN